MLVIVTWARGSRSEVIRDAAGGLPRGPSRSGPVDALDWYFPCLHCYVQIDWTLESVPRVVDPLQLLKFQVVVSENLHDISR